MIEDFLFPNRCLECNSIINSREIICPVCFDQIDFCGENDNEMEALLKKCKLLFPIHSINVLMKYDKMGLSKKILHELKYNKREKTSVSIAQWVTERIKFYDLPQKMITVPLHPDKQKKRGYNQLHLFANRLSEFYKIPVDHDVFCRKSTSKAQALKGKITRETAKTQFELKKTPTDHHLLLIDDVLTTGNTIATLAWLLLSKKKYKISILTMAYEE